nr:SDR family NAD(P)-dependent oxidoreductase [Cytophagales bacterium]
MKDKVCLVTGANSGIGFETAKSLCAKGATVIMVCRSLEKANRAISDINKEVPGARTYAAIADLASQASIHALAEKLKAEFRTVDVLVNNAGSWFSAYGVTEDKIERQWAINHLAPFLLTHLMLPLLIKSNDPRVITVSSDSHFHGKIHFDDVNLKNNYHGLRAYAQSKLANVLFTVEFERRKRATPIAAYAVQPGLVKTDIGVKHTISFHALMWKLRRLGGKSPQKGAETSIYLASDPTVSTMSGLYWDDCQPKVPSNKALDEDIAAKVWELSLAMCGVEDYFSITRNPEV